MISSVGPPDTTRRRLKRHRIGPRPPIRPAQDCGEGGGRLYSDSPTLPQWLAEARRKNLHELFVDQLKDVHSAERQLVKALPRMAKAATATALRKAFEDHLAVTGEQVEWLDAVFEEVGARPGRKTCAAMEGLVREGEGLIGQSPPAEVLDAGLIAAAQRVEHYEIAAYGTLRSYAKTLGHKGAVKLLERTLKEEATDKLLSELAEGGVNRDAVEPVDEGRGDGEKGLVGQAIRAVAEATVLASEAPKRPRARKGTGRKEGR